MVDVSGALNLSLSCCRLCGRSPSGIVSTSRSTSKSSKPQATSLVLSREHVLFTVSEVVLPSVYATLGSNIFCVVLTITQVMCITQSIAGACTRTRRFVKCKVLSTGRKPRIPLYACLFYAAMFQLHRAAAGGCKPSQKCNMDCLRLGTQWPAEPPHKSDHCSSECPTAGATVLPLHDSALLQSHPSCVHLALSQHTGHHSPLPPAMHHSAYPSKQHGL